MGTENVLLILVTVGLAAAQIGLSDPCYLTTSTGGRKVIDVEIPQNCTQGTVRWDNPAGTINLHVTRQGAQYSLCLQNNWTTKLAGLTKVVNGENIEIPLPTKIVMACAKEVNGKAQLLVSASREPLYMTSFDYKVVIIT